MACFYEKDEKNNRTARTMNGTGVDEMRGQCAPSFIPIPNIGVTCVDKQELVRYKIQHQLIN